MAARRILFILEDCAVGSPGQQLLDHFLIGYSRDGEFRRIPDVQVGVWLAPARGSFTSSADADAAIAMRGRDLELVQHTNLAEAIQDANAIVIAAPADRPCPEEALLGSVLEHASRNAVCFIYGCLTTSHATAQRLVSIAARRNLVLASGTSIAITFRLPDIDVSAGALLDEALIVVQGQRPLAELSGIDALSRIIARRSGGESGIHAVREFSGRDVWRAGERGDWSWPLLAAAISRSNTTQGDAVRDGRTQDIVGLGLVRKLAREPRAWSIEHRDGLRSAVLVLDGVVADVNFAVRTRDGTIVSAQLYRPPYPARAEFDRLTGMLEDFFITRNPPWPIERSVFISEFMEKVIS